MTVDGPNSVTACLNKLGTEDREEALRRLWDYYFPRLVQHAKTILRKMPRGIVDGEDIAASAFMAFFQGAKKGSFNDLNNRDELWKLLLTITRNKAENRRKSEATKKRGGNQVLRECDVADLNPLCDGILDKVPGKQATPEDDAIMAEDCERLFAVLSDEIRVVAILKLEGHTNEEIAQELDCSLRTVERRLDVIRNKWSSKGI